MAVIANPLLDRYRAKLATLPASGGGGCHPALLGVASLGVMAGMAAEDIFRDLRERACGTRNVSDREIQDAVDKAVQEHANQSYRPAGRPKSSAAAPAFDGEEALARIVAKGRGVTEADIHEQSPVRIDWEAREDAFHVIDVLYRPDDVLFIGARESRPAVGRNIRTAAEWAQAFRQADAGAHQPHIIPNPLTGKPGRTATGNGETLRGDACVEQFRFAVVEFDSLPREDQLAFWWAVRLPVALLVDSGGKSVHGWVAGVATVRRTSAIANSNLRRVLR
jgi:hypothetical protein